MAKRTTRSNYSAKSKKKSNYTGGVFALLVVLELVLAVYAALQFVPRYFPQHVDLVPQLGLLPEYVMLFCVAVTAGFLLLKRPFWALSCLVVTMVFSLPAQRILVEEPAPNAEVFCPIAEEKICPKCPVCPEPEIIPPMQVLYYGLDQYSFDEAGFMKTLKAKIGDDDVVILGRVNDDWLPHVKMLMDNFVTHGFFNQNGDRYALMSHRSDVMLHPVALDEGILGGKTVPAQKPDYSNDKVETLDELMERHGIRDEVPASVQFHQR